MSGSVRTVIRALLRDMGETSYVDLKGRSSAQLASDLMEMVADGEVIVRTPEDGGPRLFSLPTATADTPPAAVMGIAIYHHAGPHKPYWLAGDEMVEARVADEWTFTKATRADAVAWGMTRSFRVREDHQAYRGAIAGLYADHERWAVIPLEEALRDG